MTREFLAMYPGRCADCGGWFKQGDRIRRAGDGPWYSHVDCPETPSRLDLTPADVVCSSCYMVKPCPCDDGQATS